MHCSTAERTLRVRGKTIRAKTPPASRTTRSGKRPKSRKSQPATAAVPSTPRVERDDRDAAAGEGTCRGSPLGQGGRVNALANLGAQELEVFTQVELGAQLADGRVPLGDRFGVSRGQQPRRESVFTRSGAGGAKPLEDRADTKQIEVGGIGMINVEIGKTRGAGALPSTLEPSEPFE